MNKHKYYYNPKTLNYERIKGNWKKRIWVASGWILTTLFFAIVIYFGTDLLFESPKEARLESEVKQMKREYRRMQKELNMASDVLISIQNRDDNIYRSLFEAEPFPNAMREAGFGGSDLYNQLKGYDNSKLMIRVDSTLQKLKTKLVVQSKSFDEVEDMVKDMEARLSSLPAIQPVDNKDLKRIASGFGPRMHPVYKRRIFHKGIDFTAARGKEIYATADGVVKKAIVTSRGWGNHIVIDHGYGFETLYAHMQKFNVREGEKVKRGQIIGFVGSTGLSTAPHLHYEVHKNGIAIDPINFFHNDLSPEEYEKVIELSNTFGKSLD